MAWFFCVPKKSTSCVHYCSSHPGANDTASMSSVFPVPVWTDRLQCPSVP